MTEVACIEVKHLAILFTIATILGMSIAIVLLKGYFSNKQSREMSPSQAEMQRIAEYLHNNHPDVIVPSTNLSEITIKLLEHLRIKSQIIT